MGKHYGVFEGMPFQHPAQREALRRASTVVKDALDPNLLRLGRASSETDPNQQSEANHPKAHDTSPGTGG